MKSYKPEELFDENGSLCRNSPSLLPTATRRMGMNLHANGGLLLRDLCMPDFRDYALNVTEPGSRIVESTRVLGTIPARRDVAEPRHQEFPRLWPRRNRFKPSRCDVMKSPIKPSWNRILRPMSTFPPTAA